MTVADLPRAGTLFRRTFRGRRGAASADFAEYLHDLLFTNPLYDPATGGVVHARSDGRIDSACFSVPMRFKVGERPIVAQLMSAFMSDADGAAGAGEITLRFRPRRVDLCFTDSASPVTKAHFIAASATIIPIQGLEWRRAFQPAAMIARRLERFAPGTSGLLATLAMPVDRLLRTLHRRFEAPAATGLEDFEMSRAEFVSLAAGFVERYRVRPDWTAEELEWLLAMADGNVTLGPLRILGVREADGRVIGCVVHYGGPGRIARVLNVFADIGKETAVLRRMFRHFDERGFVGAVGGVRPSLIEGLAEQRALTFRHRAFTCLSTRHPEIVEAAARNDIYIGGLAGEGWSRLMTDFR
ncbi:MAG: GNAT family N-acetyltransferase [Ancylobacter novellus]|uniref:GNAT family N-acetyltransferase n=1 Tax=Ancylobacter novellus TaxID=921 RepID=A0A2W5KQW0_ANCNO|nr:MAG: GNAT family N-acetyltransferase [Ancylobacter novellus]